MITGSADQEQKIIDAVYRGACDRAELDRAVELIAQYFDSAGGALAEVDRAAPAAQFVSGVGSIDHAFFADYPAYAELDPAPQAFSALTTGTVSTTSHLFNKEFLRPDIFFNEFLRPHALRGLLA